MDLPMLFWSLLCIYLIESRELVTASGPNSFAEYTYEESFEHVENPGRGFAPLHTAKSSSFQALTVSHLENVRRDEGVTIVWRNYILDLYRTRDLDADILDKIEADLQVIRDARFTAVMRFYYTDVNPGQPPYGDTTKSWMLRHIGQLSDTLTQHEDVIDSMQAGFIGVWGEWYYTGDEFGDPRDFDWNYPRGIKPYQWQNRREVLQALIDATPDSISIEVRVPTYKREIVNDYSATSRAEAEAAAYKGRTGHHNDCFLASGSDFGTYVNKSEEYPYLQADITYTSMGGETCGISTDPPNRHKCPTATKELEDLQFTYLNSRYHQGVLMEWVVDGCFPEIHRRLGYRLVLLKTVLPNQVNQNSSFSVHIELTNKGYAAPHKPLALTVILQNGPNTFEASVPEFDFRDLVPGAIVNTDADLFVPELVPVGQYEVFLALKDSRHPEWSDFHILLANKNVPEHRQGINKLGHTVQVAGSEQVSASQPMFTPVTLPEPSKYSRLYCEIPGTCPPSVGCELFPVANPSFEINNTGWYQYMDGFSYTRERASHGQQSIKIDGSGGARQVFTFPSGVRSFHLEADSISEGVVGTAGPDYSIYCDVKFMNGDWSYGNTADFSLNQASWETRVLTVTSQQDMEEAWCYGMFRNYPTGTAFFDKFVAFIRC